MLIDSFARLMQLFFFHWYGDHRNLHSFPTRRSSDLKEHDEGKMETSHSGRRSFMKMLAAAPLLGRIAVSDLYAEAASAVGKPRQNVYTRLGVRTVIKIGRAHV